MKNVYHISNKQHGGIKSGILRSKNSTILQVVCAGVLSCWKVSTYPHKCVKVIVLGIFCSAMLKLQQFVISKPDEVHHRRRAAIQQLSAFGCDKQVCTHGTL